MTAAAVALEGGDAGKAGPNLGAMDNEDTISEDFMKGVGGMAPSRTRRRSPRRSDRQTAGSS